MSRVGNSEPTVSILLPVYNASSTLDAAIGSIQAQTLDAWELIAIDDGSEDDSLERLRSHASRDSRLRIVELSHRGIAPALEAGRQQARAPLIARMDADDRAHPDRLAEQVSFIRGHPGVAACGTHVRYFPRREVRDGALRYERWLNSLFTTADLVRDLWIECPLAHPSLLVRAAALDRVGGYRDPGWPEDYDLVLRMWAEGLGLGVVPRVLHHWRESSTRLSRIDPRYSPERFRRAKLEFLRQTLLAERDGLVIWGAGPVGKAFARAANRSDIRVRAFVDLDPRKVGQTIHGAPVLSTDAATRLLQSLHVAAVGQPGAREEIRRTLSTLGREEGKDFVAVA